MKKLLLILFSLSIFIPAYYPQSLRKVEAVKEPVKKQINLPLDKQYKVSASSFTESFESTTFPPVGWQVFTYGGTGWERLTVGTKLPMWTTSKVITTPPGGGNAVAYCTWNDSTIFNNQWIITPLIQNIQSSDTLFFWMRNQISSFADSIYIYYTDGTNYFNIGHIYYDGTHDTSWGKWYLPVGKVISAGSDIFLAFEEFVQDNGIDGGAISLDLVEIQGSTTTAAPAVTTKPATNITESTATLNGSVNANNSSTTVIFEYGTTASYGSSITAVPGQVTGTNETDVSADLTGLQSNTTYHYRVRGTSNAGVSGGADETFTTNQALIYPSSINLSSTFTFGTDISKSSSYRMIGLPGSQTNFGITDLITAGTRKTDWNAYYDNGDTSTTGLVEFDGSTLFNFTPGKGFWILNKTQLSINKTVPTVSLLNNSYSNIPVHFGWNIISNPFEINVDWVDVQNTNGLNTNEIIYSWNGSAYTQPSVFENYKGFYFYNAVSARNSIRIPYTFTITITKSNNTNSISAGNNIKLSVLHNKEEKSYVEVGFNSMAKMDYDKFDYLTPPGDFEEVKISIEDRNLSIPYKQLCIDYRPDINEGQTYDLLIKNALKENVKLAASGLENLTGSEVYLFDESSNRFYNLKNENEIDLPTVHSKSNFKLLIGDESFINKIKNEQLPKEYSLYQNYPNPFNPETKIEYSVPLPEDAKSASSAKVELKVYDILGNEIAVLVNESKPAGKYETEFNAKGLPSGVYIYQLKAGNYIATKKMVLLK